LRLCVVYCLPPPPASSLFPYTTLFRSVAAAAVPRRAHRTGAAEIAQRVMTPAIRIEELTKDYAVGFWRRRPYRALDHLSLEIPRSEEHTSELQSRENLVCRLLLEKKKT